MSPEVQQFRKLLKSNGHFITKPRLRLFALLQKHNEMTIKQLITLLDRHDQATVYRNILVFEELGIINRLRLGWQSKLELSDLLHEHHHHATCNDCGKTISLPEDPALEKHIYNLSTGTGFSIATHTLEIRGLCASCQIKRPQENILGSSEASHFHN
jgi:Fe2+ or Zn2+ uptake regulation protein